jgi:hypothetical protein
MGLTLRTPPGFADLADAALVHDSAAFAINIAKIYENACFGVGRTEFFQGFYKNGDQVPLPTSRIDGRPYARTDLLYIWFVRNSTDPQSLWITGADSLFYCNWLVDQATGNVFCDEWYRRSGSHADVTHTNDGKLEVWTIAQRQMSDLIVASSPTYSAITAGTIAQDKPFTELMAQALNRNAKFAALDHEVHYLGEYYNGQTVTMPTSLADGHLFASSECKFHFSWRWTALGNSSSLVRPPLGYGQMGPLKASVNSSGVVSVSVDMIDDSGNLNVLTNLGRIAVFAFCKRSGTPGSITPAAVNFAEISFDEFMPGSFLKFPTVQQIIKNIEQSLLSPEYFGPTAYANGDTIPVPTSTVDSYVYSRSELQYIPVWSDTSNQTGSNLRLPLFFGSIDPNTGVVTLHVWRLPPGGAYVDDDDALARISVMVVARRLAAAPSSVTPPTTSTPGDVGTPGQVDLPNGSALQVNGVAIPSPETGNFNDSTPAAPTGERNVNFQMDALSPTQISGHVPNVGGVDPRTTVTESIGLASQGKLVTLNNASAVAVSLDSTAGGGGGGSPTVDVLNWIAIPFADRTTRHLVGTGVYAANWMDADGQKLWLIKNSAGNPWDIYTFDSSFVYHWITENADEGTWSSANAWKRFLTPVPVMPRFFNTSGPPVTTITNGSNPIQRTTACGTDGEPLINIGNMNEVLSYTASVVIGGDVGTQPALILTHSYGHQREQFYYCQGFGLVKWTHANLSGGVYVVDQTTLHNTWASGACPTPNFPCYATVLAAGNWIGGAPGSGGNVANPSSSPPTTSGVPSTFFCAVKNIGAGTVTFTPTSGTIDVSTLATGEGGWLFFNGTNWTLLKPPTPTPPVNIFAIVSGVTGKPAAGQIVAIYTAFSAETFPANFGSPQQSYGSVGTNPTATASYTVNKNGSSVGTISISTSGVFTFTTSGGTAISLAASDRVTIVAPSSQDTTLADVGITLVGTR